MVLAGVSLCVGVKVHRPPYQRVRWNYFRWTLRRLGTTLRESAESLGRDQNSSRNREPFRSRAGQQQRALLRNLSVTYIHGYRAQTARFTLCGRSRPRIDALFASLPVATTAEASLARKIHSPPPVRKMRIRGVFFWFHGRSRWGCCETYIDIRYTYSLE